MSDVSSILSNQKTIEQIIESNAKTSTASTRNTGELGKDDFLQLLITQLQHQDPMNPSSDQDFIAQVAQFSSLEQMKNMNTSMQYQQGFGMMGKYISAVISDETTGSQRTVSGEVTSVRMVSGEVMLVVGDNEVPIDKVEQVADNAEGVGATADLSKYNTLIGLMGTASLKDANELVKKIDGIVSKVEKTDAGLVATLDEVELIPVIDKGAFESEDAYLKAMNGREVSFRVKDATTGASVTVKGTLRSHEVASDGKMHVILDGVETGVENITATRRVDLFSSEQLLLAQILEQIRQLAGTDQTADENAAAEEAAATMGDNAANATTEPVVTE